MSTITQNPTQYDNDGNFTDKAREKAEAVSSSVTQKWSRITTETRRTICYAATAIAFIAITGVFEWSSRPASIEEFGKIGQPFFPDFQDPTRAVALTVAAIDEDQVSAQEFAVERRDNGQWVIPSHHDYPADAEEQLARTASSVIGITRGAMVSRWASDHARYGVVDPKTDTLGVDEIQGVGKRLTLRGEDDSTLADYIIGKQVDGEFDQYYVRHPSEDETYVATLDIDLSTRFADWIDTDLLDVNTSEIVHVGLNDYQFDELNATVTQRDVTTLHRDSASDDWQMDQIDADIAEVDQDAVRTTITALTKLEISGVRPKQKGLTPALQLDVDALGSQRDVDRLQSDLLSRGFLLQPVSESEPDKLKLIAREGELSTATDEGLVYNLYFGRVFTGSQEELEIGFGDKTDKNSSDNPDPSTVAVDADAESETEANTDESKNSQPTGKPGRYVFVTVDFDKQYLGDEPTKPTEPEMPDELKAVDDANEPSDNGKADTSDHADEADNEASKDDAESKLAELRECYEKEKSEYESQLRHFESYQSKVESGQEKADDLNRRFAQWYYVIPGDDYDKLAVTRTGFIKAKPIPEPEKDGEDTGFDTEASSDSDSTEQSQTAESNPDSEEEGSTNETPPSVAEGKADAPDAQDFQPSTQQPVDETTSDTEQAKTSDESSDQ